MTLRKVTGDWLVSISSEVGNIPTTPTLAATWTNAKAAYLDENISAAKTLTTAERTAIRKSVCASGDIANSIGKILYDLHNTRLTSTRATNLDELAAANLPTDVANVKSETAAILADVTGINGSAMIGTNNAALAATALSTATWTGAKAAFLNASISAIPTTMVGTNNAALASVCTEARLAHLTQDIPNMVGTNNAALAATALSTAVAGADITTIKGQTDTKDAGRPQVFMKSVTSAANAGDITLATVTTSPCIIDSIVVHADTASQTDLTSAAVSGGAVKVVTFIDATDAAKANIDEADEQVAWTGAAYFGVGRTITMTLVGTGPTAVELFVSINYHANVDGGYLA